MQQFCPDILITNYSMLEYTLLRPIEAKIWNDTRKWLHEKEENRLLFIIDEAHKSDVHLFIDDDLNTLLDLNRQGIDVYLMHLDNEDVICEKIKNTDLKIVETI